MSRPLETGYGESTVAEEMLPAASWVPAVLNSGFEEQEHAPDDADRDLERKARSYLDAIRSCSPKHLELVERFRPMVEETFAKIQADYRSLTGSKETFHCEIVQGGFRNAFMLSPINTIVLTIELFEEAVRLAINKEGAVAPRLLRDQLRYVIAHELGHKHHGTFREDCKRRMEERRAQGDKAATLTTPEIAEILEQRAHHISLESACDRFAIDLARHGREEVDGLLLGLHLIKKLQDREEIESREKRNRMTFEVIEERDTDAFMDEGEKDEEDEAMREQAGPAGDEHEEWGSMSLFYEEDEENEEEGTERKKIEKDERALRPRVMSAKEKRRRWKREEMESEWEAWEAAQKQRMDTAERRVPSILLTHPEIAWRTKVFEEALLKTDAETTPWESEPIPIGPLERTCSASFSRVPALRELRTFNGKRDLEKEIRKHRLIFSVMNASCNLPLPSWVKEEEPWKTSLEAMRFGAKAHEPATDPAAMRDMAVAAVSSAKELDEHFVLAALDRAWQNPDLHPLQLFWRVLLRAQYAAQLFPRLSDDEQDVIVESIFTDKKYNMPDDFEDVIQSIETPSDALPMLRFPWFCELITCRDMIHNLRTEIVEHMHYDENTQSFSLQKFFADKPFAIVPAHELVAFFEKRRTLLTEMRNTEKAFLEDHYLHRSAAVGAGKDAEVRTDFSLLIRYQDQLAVVALARGDLASMERVLKTKPALKKTLSQSGYNVPLHSLCMLDEDVLKIVKGLFTHRVSTFQDLIGLLEQFPEHIDVSEDDLPLRPTPFDHGHRALMQRFYRKFVTQEAQTCLYRLLQRSNTSLPDAIHTITQLHERGHWIVRTLNFTELSSFLSIEVQKNEAVPEEIARQLFTLQKSVCGVASAQQWMPFGEKHLGKTVFVPAHTNPSSRGRAFGQLCRFLASIEHPSFSRDTERRILGAWLNNIGVAENKPMLGTVLTNENILPALIAEGTTQGVQMILTMAMQELSGSRSTVMTKALARRTGELPTLFKSQWLPSGNRGHIPYRKNKVSTGDKLRETEIIEDLPLLEVSLLHTNDLTPLLIVLDRMLASQDDYQRLSALEWLSGLFGENTALSMGRSKRKPWSIPKGITTDESQAIPVQMQKRITEHFGMFDGENGLLFAFDELPKDQNAAEQFMEKLMRYVERVIRVPGVGTAVITEFFNRLPLSGAFRRRCLMELSWGEKDLEEQLRLRIRERVEQVIRDPESIEGALEKNRFKRTPVRIARAGDIGYGDAIAGAMARCYEQSEEEGFFEPLTPLERFHEITRSIYPVKSALRDQALMEQVRPETLTTEQCLILRNAFEDVHMADETAHVLYEQLRRDNELPMFRTWAAQTTEGMALLHELGLSTLDGAPSWKLRLFELLSLFPVASYRRDELLGALTNAIPEVGESDSDIPTSPEDVTLISHFYVESGTLRNDEHATRRMLELEFIFTMIRQLRRSQRIDLLLVVMGIEMSNETTRAFEQSVRRRIPSFQVNSERFTRREQELMLLEVFEGEDHGVFVPPTKEDPADASRLLSNIAQFVGAEGSEEMRLRLSNLIYRILEKCHWTKRLQLTQDVLRFVRRGSTLPEMVRGIVCSLGPVFMKGAQQEGQQSWVSRRFRDALIELNDNVPLIPKDAILDIVDREVGLSHYRAICEPLGSASLAQVHRAILRDGTEVALKVLRPGVRKQMNEDLRLADELINFVNANEELFGVKLNPALKKDIDASLCRQIDLQKEIERRDQYASAIDTLRPEFAVQDMEVGVPTIVRPDLTRARIVHYSYVHGISLAKPGHLERLADFLGYEVAEARSKIALALLTIQGGTLMKAEHSQRDPNRGNTLLTITGVEQSTADETRGKVQRALRRIRAGSVPGEELSRREVRALDLGVQLVDFGHIEENPPQYKEMVHHCVWGLLSGDLQKLEDLLLEFHIGSYRRKDGRALDAIPPVNTAALRTDILEYAEREFGETVAKLLDSVNEEKFTNERAKEFLITVAKKHDVRKVFQDFLEIIDRHGMIIPADLMSILRSWRIGSYIFDDISTDDLWQFAQKIISKRTAENAQSRFSQIMEKVVPKRLRDMIRTGVRALAPLRTALEEESGKPWTEAILERVRNAKIDELFEELRPGERRNRYASAELIAEYKRLHAEGKLSAVQGEQLEGYAPGVMKLETAYKIDTLPEGTVIQFTAENKGFRFDANQPESAHVELTYALMQPFSFANRRGVKVLRGDITYLTVNPSVLLPRAVVLYNGTWFRGADLLKFHGGEGPEDFDPETLSQTIPPSINEYLANLEAKVHRGEH